MSNCPGSGGIVGQGADLQCDFAIFLSINNLVVDATKPRLVEFARCELDAAPCYEPIMADE